jgi:hypothetical protein
MVISIGTVLLAAFIYLAIEGYSESKRRNG